MMKTSQKMAALIIMLAQKHGLDLNAPRAYLRLELGNSALEIEKIGEYLVSLTHSYGDTRTHWLSVQFVFYTGHDEWVPLEHNRYEGVYQAYGELRPDEIGVILNDPPGQAKLAGLVETKAGELNGQNWLEQAYRRDEAGRWEPSQSTPLTPPDIETLIRWEAEGGCEAACPEGCWVEADGRCSHGHPSWLLKLGLI